MTCTLLAVSFVVVASKEERGAANSEHRFGMHRYATRLRTMPPQHYFRRNTEKTSRGLCKESKTVVYRCIQVKADAKARRGCRERTEPLHNR